MKIDMHKVRPQLSKLGRLAWQGEEIIITRDGEPYLRLEPYRERKSEQKPERKPERKSERKPKRKLGVLKGQIWIAPDFDDTPQEIIDAFQNSRIFPDEKDNA